MTDEQEPARPEPGQAVREASERPGPEAGARAEAPAPARASRRRRWLTALVIFLLIAIPAGYIVISAEQSRDSGQSKEEEAAATGLYNDYPSKVQQRIYNVPVPAGSTPVYYYEANAWHRSSLYVQFRTNEWGLDHYLKWAGTSRAALKDGEITITGAQAAKVGWDLASGGQWAGTSIKNEDPGPSQRITVNFDEPGHPVVYVVSTVAFKR
ncbi:hypothetical protein ACH4FX_36960 [Streptomyces sp. NPDC018019]|uniref:hypothetical protein n=1 Tax=Streptomyces sp. NPDC018019 TaxID=3365030 RepID=UPI0037967C7A